MPVKLVEKARRLTYRLTRSPFPADLSERPILVHGSHHKVGTVWFQRVLGAIAGHYGLRFHYGDQNGLRGADIFMQDHSRIEPAGLGAFHGSHMVRDPRDVVISAYFYHLRTTEPWVSTPRPIYGGLGYQAYLRGLDQEAGLQAEIERCARTDLKDMLQWNYEDPRFLELRYEEILADEETWFQRLFTHYGFTPDAVATCTEIALGFSLRKVKARTSHIRSGQPGEWQSHFTAEHRQAFKELTGDAAVRLGYASDSNW